LISKAHASTLRAVTSMTSWPMCELSCSLCPIERRPSRDYQLKILLPVLRALPLNLRYHTTSKVRLLKRNSTTHALRRTTIKSSSTLSKIFSETRVVNADGVQCEGLHEKCEGLQKNRIGVSRTGVPGTAPQTSRSFGIRHITTTF
jgi:hypothetical protein